MLVGLLKDVQETATNVLKPSPPGALYCSGVVRGPMGKLPTCKVKFACTGDVVDVRTSHGLWPLAGCTKIVPSLTVPGVSKALGRMVTQKVFSGNPFGKKLNI